MNNLILGKGLSRIFKIGVKMFYEGLTRFEKTRIISARALKLDAGFLARRPFGDRDRDLAMSPKLESEDRLS